MTVFDDMNRFLEERLDEFLKAHPDLELQVLDDQLREQEAKTQATLRQLAAEEQQTQQTILKTAQEVQRWNERIDKAEQAKRTDLVQAARDREAALLRQGNQQWAQLALIKQQIQQSQEQSVLLKNRRQDLQVKIREQAQRQPQRQPTPSAWQGQATAKVSTGSTGVNGPDPLEEQFKRLEMEAELEALKRKMGR